MRIKNIINEKENDLKRKILVIDDEQGVIDSLKVYLGKEGYIVEGETNPLLGIENIRNNYYDILILDYIMMPINGDKVIEEIRKFNNNIYIIVLTGHKCIAPPIETIRRLNIQGYLEKTNKLSTCKSPYMKQVALNIIMAHIGSYVAADYAKIPIVDKIFTRVGASDDLLTGQSTFMLEMTEVASILNSATKKSFVVLDEIGRGTSTYDGISIATAITEYIHNVIGAKTIFATHYHELTELEKELERAINFRVEVKEDGKNVVFLREIVKGGADKSYGIEVARLSGVPKEVLNRSRKILKKLETRKNLIENKIKAEQMMLFGTGFEEDFEEEETEILSENEVKVLDILKNMDLNSMSPLESLLKLNELKKILIGGTDE